MGRPSASKLSALTALNVPTPPVAAQLPEERPVDTDTPLPPSTSGRTSTPPMRIALIAIIVARPRLCPEIAPFLEPPASPRKTRAREEADSQRCLGRGHVLDAVAVLAA